MSGIVDALVEHGRALRVFMVIASFILGVISALGLLKFEELLRLQYDFPIILMLLFVLIAGLTSLSYLILKENASSLEFKQRDIKERIDMLAGRESETRAAYEMKLDQLSEELSEIRKTIGRSSIDEYVSEEGRMILTKSGLKELIKSIGENAPRYLGILECYASLRARKDDEFVELHELLEKFSSKERIPLSEANDLFIQLRKILPDFVAVQTDRRDKSYVRIRNI